MSRQDDGFTDRLRHAVERAGGVPAVAKAVSVTPQAVYGWLAGSRPYQRTLTKLCVKLGVRQQWLLDGDGPEESGPLYGGHGGSKLREDSLLTPMHDSTPASDKSEEDLVNSLVELIAGYDALPPAYESLALAAIESHYLEFHRRAKQRAAVRASLRQAGGVKYQPKNSKPK